MTASRDAIVAEARAWLGVPWHHQGRSRAGCDCGGLVGGVAERLGLVPPGWWSESFDPSFGGYGRVPTGDSLRRVCATYMQELPVAAALPGDVLLMRFRDAPQHLAIAADYVHGGLSIVHSMSTVGRVAEHRLSAEWRARIVAVYALPGVA